MISLILRGGSLIGVLLLKVVFVDFVDIVFFVYFCNFLQCYQVCCTRNMYEFQFHVIGRVVECYFVIVVVVYFFNSL